MCFLFHAAKMHSCSDDQHPSRQKHHLIYYPTLGD
jgi:hypothetical protein